MPESNCTSTSASDSPSPNTKVTRTPWALDPSVQIIEVTYLKKPTDDYIEKRMEMLRKMLSDSSLSHQHENYKAALAMYETGATPDNTQDGWYFVNGKFYEEQPVLEQLPRGSVVLPEKRHFQYYQNSSPPPASQFPHSTAYGLGQGSSMHEIPILIRLIPLFGGDPTRVRKVRVGNDTGSDLQTLCPDDLRLLGYNPQTYQGNMGNISINTANGPVSRDTLLVEVQVLKNDEITPLTGWIMEQGVIMPAQLGIGFHQHLSGDSIRKHLYFATAPGNQQLYVARSKNGIVTQLPAV